MLDRERYAFEYFFLSFKWLNWLTSQQLDGIGRCMYFDWTTFCFISIIDLLTHSTIVCMNNEQLKGESHLILIKLFIRHLSIAWCACIGTCNGIILHQSMYLDETIVSCDGGTLQPFPTAKLRYFSGDLLWFHVLVYNIMLQLHSLLQ